MLMAYEGRRNDPFAKVTAFLEATMWTKRHTEMSIAQERKLLHLTATKVVISSAVSLEAETQAKEKYRDATEDFYSQLKFILNQAACFKLQIMFVSHGCKGPGIASLVPVARKDNIK